MKNQTLEQFMADLASSAPTPGGGAVAALTGALSAALSSMVANLGVESPKYADHLEDNRATVGHAAELIRENFNLMQADADAFSGFMKALKMPKSTEDEKAARKVQLKIATEEAIIAPMQTMRAAARLAKLAFEAAEKGNRGAITDAAIAAHLATVTAKAASYNVLINLKSLRDEEYSAKCIAEMNLVIDLCRDYCAKVDALTDKELS